MTSETGLVLLSHGSVRETRAETLRSHALRLHSAGWTRSVIGYLNYGSPSFEEAMATIAADGATNLVIVPYFLVAGQFMTQDVPKRVAEFQAANLQIPIRIASALLDAPEMVDAILDVAGDGEWDAWIVIAHGSPIEESNADIRHNVMRVRARSSCPDISIAYLDCNEPTIPNAIDASIRSGARRILIIPYFLHNGKHVATDVPDQVRSVQVTYPSVSIEFALHVGSSVHVTKCLARRAAEANGADAADSSFHTKHYQQSQP